MPLTRRVLGRYGSAIQRLVGGSSLGGTQFQFYRPGQVPNTSTPEGAVGYAENGTVYINRGYWKDASRQDKRGFLVHELTHLSAGRSNNEETVADAVRLALTGKGPQAGGWTPSADARKYARQQGWLGMTGGTDNNGPKAGNRNRDTVVNNNSKSGVPAPPVSSQSAVNYAAQQAQLRMQLAATLANLRSQAGVTRGQYVSTLGDIKAQRIADTAAAEGSALQSGTVGSSADLQNRAAAVTAAAGQRVDARMQRNLALIQLRQQGVQARTDYVQGVQGIAAQAAAEQAALANNELTNNLLASQSHYNELFKKFLEQYRQTGRKRPPVGAPGLPTPQNQIDRQGYELGPYNGQAQPY